MGLKAAFTVYALGFIVVLGLVGLNVAQNYQNTFATPSDQWALALACSLVGFVFGAYSFNKLVIVFQNMGKMALRDRILGVLGLSLGALLAFLLMPLVQNAGDLATPLSLLMVIVLVFVAIGFALSMRDEIVRIFPRLDEVDHESSAAVKLLDTNVIIDGRILDVWETGFLEGPMQVPDFVLAELQHIADSADDLKRSRGRRGLEILRELQKKSAGRVTILSKYPSEANSKEAVDLRLVKLAKAIGASIVTNDFGLNQVASLHAVTVLNINELANSLKPVVLPGEVMVVTIVRHGKGPKQGVGYLDDGTMVVIEGAREHIGDTLEATVTSVIQTVAGKMIFADINPESLNKELTDAEQNISSYSGSRSRKPGGQQ